MSFLSSIFLWALPLTAVPVVIHLLSRRRREVIRWGAMELLLAALPRKKNIWRIDDLVLLVVRVLAVAAVVLAFSRPQVRSSAFSDAAPGRDVILVVDASLSTGRLVDGKPVLEAVKRAATDALARLEGADKVRLMLAAGSGYWVAAEGAPDAAAIDTQATRELIAQRISELKPTQAAADMPVCLQTALMAEAPADTTGRLILVVTDGIAHGWSADSGSRWQAVQRLLARAAVPTAINIVTVDAPQAPFRNLSVEKAATNRTRVAAGEPLSLTAQVRNVGDVACAAATLHWTARGEPAGDSAVPALEPGASAEVSLEAVCGELGVFNFSCRLGEADDLPEDNATSLIVESVERLPVLVCRPEGNWGGAEGEPDFLLAALGKNPNSVDNKDVASVFEPTTISIEALAGTDLSRYRCVILDDAIPTSTNAVESLTDFVAHGGGLWVILGPKTTSERFNEVLYHDGGGLAPVSLGEQIAADGNQDDKSHVANELITVHPPEGLHPATLLLGDTDRLDIDDVRIRRHWKLTAQQDAEEFSVLLESGDGRTLAAERYFGDGRVIVMGLPTNAQWSNLPLCQTFVPLAQEWVWYLTQPTATRFNLESGIPFVAGSPIAKLKQVDVHTPLDRNVTLAAEQTSGGKVRFHETLFPGDYEAVLTPEEGVSLHLPFYVRRDANESRLAPLTADQTASLSQAGSLRFGVDPLSPPDKVDAAISYHPFWNYLLGLLILLFLLEFLFMRVLTFRRYADPLPTSEGLPSAVHSNTQRRRQPA